MVVKFILVLCFEPFNTTCLPSLKKIRGVTGQICFQDSYLISLLIFPRMITKISQILLKCWGSLDMSNLTLRNRMSCSDMKYSENFGQTVPGDSTLRMNQTKNRPVERSVASLFCWVTELKFDWLLSCYCTTKSYFFEKAFIFQSTCVLTIYWWQIHNLWVAQTKGKLMKNQRNKNTFSKIIWLHYFELQRRAPPGGLK